MVKPLLFPAIEDAKTSSERFDTKRYTPAQKAVAYNCVRDKVRALLIKHRYGILYLDTNSLIFENDKYCDKTLERTLKTEFGFRLGHVSLRGESLVLVDQTKLCAIILVQPFGVSGGSRPESEVPMACCSKLYEV